MGERSAPEGRATLAFPRMRKDPRFRERGGGPKPGQHLRTCIVFIELDRATLAEACVGVAERRADRPLARGLLKRVVSHFQRTAQELGAPECALRDELATRGPFGTREIVGQRDLGSSRRHEGDAGESPIASGSSRVSCARASGWHHIGHRVSKLSRENELRVRLRAAR